MFNSRAELAQLIQDGVMKNGLVTPEMALDVLSNYIIQTVHNKDEAKALFDKVTELGVAITKPADDTQTDEAFVNLINSDFDERHAEIHSKCSPNPDRLLNIIQEEAEAIFGKGNVDIKVISI